jgi:surface carbohydrate biosynthesis protein
MKIIWIIDNKFRELYGLNNLKKNLLKHNIKLYLFNIPIWKSAINFIRPNIIVVPNLFRTSCEPIVNYAKKKKIDVFMHSSEGMFYNDEIQKVKYPTRVIKKVKKILVWGKLDSKYLIKKGYKNKVVETGCLKFDKKNYLQLDEKKKNKKIKVIGIPTHMRLFTGSGISKFNIPYYIRKYIREKKYDRLGYLKFEFDYIELLSKIIERLNSNYKVVFKVSPFEDPNIYRKAFPKQEIFKGDDVRDFLNNVDVILNIYSSISVDSLKFNVPVINLSNLVEWNTYILKNKRLGPSPSSYLNASKLGVKVKNINDLLNLLRKDKKYLISLSVKNNFFKNAEKLAGAYDSLNMFTQLFINYKKNIKLNSYNYIYLFKYVLVEIKQFFFGRPKPANYRWWSFADQKLLQKLKITK